jgi:heme oxygenase
VLYVGHRMVAAQHGLRRHLVTQLPGLEDAFAYLAACERGAPAWRAYERTVARLAAKPETANEIVAAASEAFACASRWTDDDLEGWRVTG